MGEHIAKLERKLLKKKEQVDNIRKELARQFSNPFEDDDFQVQDTESELYYDTREHH